MTKSTQSVFKAIVKWKRQVVGQVVQEGTAAAALPAAAGQSAGPSACSKPVNSYLQSTHKSIIRPSEDCQTRADNHKKIVRQDRNLNIQFIYIIFSIPFHFIPSLSICTFTVVFSIIFIRTLT